MAQKMNRPMNSQELIQAVIIKVAGAALIDSTDKLKRVLDEEEQKELCAIGQRALVLFEACATATGDEMQALLARRRADHLKIGVSYDQKKLRTKIVLEPDELSTLIGHALNYCDYQCPFVETTDEGERFVNTSAVKGCELRKIYKSIGVAHSDMVGQGCPYHIYI